MILQRNNPYHHQLLVVHFSHAEISAKLLKTVFSCPFILLACSFSNISLRLLSWRLSRNSPTSRSKPGWSKKIFQSQWLDRESSSNFNHRPKASRQICICGALLYYTRLRPPHTAQQRWTRISLVSTWRWGGGGILHNYEYCITVIRTFVQDCSYK